MIYGLYQSAAGIQTSSYRQDVIANNIANAETPGFKRDIALFKERLTEAQEQRGGMGRTWTDPRLESLSGGILAVPTRVDTRPGEFEPTGNPLDLAIEGEGYFQVKGKDDKTFLTRNGQFSTDNKGNLILANETGQRVLDAKGKTITLSPKGGPASISKDGTVSQGSKNIGRIGAFTVADQSKFTKQGGTLINTQGQTPTAIEGVFRSGVAERSNVDPTTELASLMDAQRQLEANANMIRYQDQTLGRLVNEVGKIG